MFEFLVTRVIARSLRKRGKLKLLMWLMLNLKLKDAAAKRSVWYPLLMIVDLML